MNKPVCRLMLAAIAALLVPIGRASATWSILLVDLKTGEIAVGSATCLTRFDLQQNTPVLIPGLGAATAQSFVDVNGFNRTLIRDSLLDGLLPSSIVDALASFDPGHETRQYGIVRVGAEAATFTGLEAGAWAGGLTGVLVGAGPSGGDIAYAIQGNVLTGEPVVTGALQAIADDQGDLPEKLMAGMVAARLLGGDGRCSCTGRDPTGCGPVVSNPEKSADIAYMLVARAGDTEGCAPSYRLPSDLLVVEMLRDPLGTLFVVGRSVEPSLEVFERVDRGAGGRLIARPPVDVPEPIGQIAPGDVTGDGLSDLVVAGADGTGIWLLARAQDGSFEQPSLVDGAAAAGAMLILPADGLSPARLAVAATANDEVRIYEAADGSLELADALDVASPRLLGAAEMLETPGQELVVVSGDPATLVIFSRDGDGVYGQARLIATDRTSPSGLAAIDIDKDGFDEVVLSRNSDRTVAIFADDGPYMFQPTLSLPTSVRDLRVVTDDKGEQALLLATLSSIEYLEPGFAFIPLLLQGTPTPLDFAGTALFPVSDGLFPDLAVFGGSQRLLRLLVPRGDTYPLTSGCGDGEFFLEFNVAFAERSDPDPVDQLLARFDEWSAERVGRPDAVVSSAVLSKDVIEASEGCRTDLTVVIRDRNGLELDTASIDVALTESSQMTVTLDPAQRIGPGSFRIGVRSNGGVGTSRLVVRVADEDGATVTLMPPAEIRTRLGADLDGDGERTPADFDIWLAAFAVDDPAADQNADGRVDSSDYFAFIVNYFGGCS